MFPYDDQGKLIWYRKQFACTCGCQWEDEWDCLCNDKCPHCNKEIEPHSWEEIGGLSEEDIRRLIA